MQYTNSHGLPSPVEKKGWHGHLSRGEHLWVLQPLSQEESTPTLVWTGFYCFPVTLHQRRFLLFLDLVKRLLLTDNKRKKLQIQGKNKNDWFGYISSLGHLSTDFRELLQRCTLNICSLNSAWRSFSKSKSHSSPGTMQTWFPRGKPICTRGSCGLPHMDQFSGSILGYIRHCHADQFPISTQWK